MRAETAQEARDFVSAGRKNLIINGAMNVFQRNNSGLVTTGSSSIQYQIDRFGGQFFLGNVFTVDRPSDAPSGFTYSLRYTTTNALTPDNSHYFHTGQNIEGFNFNQVGWTSTNKKPITLSFWVKSSVVGTWAVAFKSYSATYGYLTTYNINVANTWEYKTITVPPPSSSSWNTTDSTALRIQFDIGTSRSDLYGSSRNVWLSENLYSDENTTKIHGISGATWQIAGVQLEVGKNATEFEHRSYGEELALCERYFQIIADAADNSSQECIEMAVTSSTTGVFGCTTLRTTMRTTPTIYNTATNFRINSPGGGDANSTTAPTLSTHSGRRNVRIEQSGYTGLTANFAGTLRLNGGTGIVAMQAEL
jgi:hypothetical protein